MIREIRALQSRSRNRLLATVIAVLVSGCTHTERAAKTGILLSPRPPFFLTGPVATLLTNNSGFSAHVVVQTRWAAKMPETLSGELLGWQGKLLFAPNYEKSSDKNYRAAGLSFLWDVPRSAGLVLSEALQAYAPVGSDSSVTNVMVRPRQLSPQKIDGHPCELVQAAFFSSDGSVAVFDVWRAVDAKELPLRISQAGTAGGWTLELSKLRLGAPSAELFRPPDGFTMYESAEGMMGELATRQANLRRKEPSEPIEQTMGAPNRPPAGH